jgi:2-succinyl-5-enolpyruvyl-6-hydroxy-3-cyclohexene-1-carboxylate synthase
MTCPSTDVAAEFVLSTVDEAYARACGTAGAQGGGVHVNWQFREPLSPDAREWDIGWLWSIARWTKSSAPWRTALEPLPSTVEIDDAVVVAGRMPAAAEASLHGWKGTLLADIASSLAGPGTAGADLVLRAVDAGNHALREAIRPAALAIAGDAIVSKRLNAWITAQSCATTVFGAGDPRIDAAHRADAVYAGPVSFRAARRLRPHPAWKRALACAARASAKALASERTLCEPTAIADACAACTLGHGTIFHGSSMPIRDADFLAIPQPKGWSASANRGASGIDGLIASAAGHAHASGEPVVAFVGDVSALHDLNSLQLATLVETPLVLVVLNNDGGGIFRYLPVARHGDVFEACFTTPHGLSFAPIAKSFGLAAETPKSRAAMAKSVAKALKRGGTTVIEVACTREASEQCRARVAQAAVDALAREFR